MTLPTSLPKVHEPKCVSQPRLHLVRVVEVVEVIQEENLEGMIRTNLETIRLLMLHWPLIGDARTTIDEGMSLSVIMQWLTGNRLEVEVKATMDQDQTREVILIRTTGFLEDLEEACSIEVVDDLRARDRPRWEEDARFSTPFRLTVERDGSRTRAQLCSRLEAEGA